MIINNSELIVVTYTIYKERYFDKKIYYADICGEIDYI